MTATLVQPKGQTYLAKENNIVEHNINQPPPEVDKFHRKAVTHFVNAPKKHSLKFSGKKTTLVVSRCQTEIEITKSW